jgi:hypothetical protein
MHYNLYYNTHLHLFYTLCNKIDIDPKDPNSNFALILHVFSTQFLIH